MVSSRGEREREERVPVSCALHRRPCFAFNRARERNRYRRSPGSPHKYTAEEERRLRRRERRGREREREREGERGGRTKGEPTNCYTALWCHSSLLRHGPGIVGMVSASSPLLSLIPSACVRPLLLEAFLFFRCLRCQPAFVPPLHACKRGFTPITAMYLPMLDTTLPPFHLFFASFLHPPLLIFSLVFSSSSLSLFICIYIYLSLYRISMVAASTRSLFREFFFDSPPPIRVSIDSWWERGRHVFRVK